MEADPTILVNCGTIVTGNIRQPVADGDAILVRDGKISAIGRSDNLVALCSGATVINAQGMDVVPGLIDGHLHLVFGDWSPRMSALGWLAGYVQAGITTGCQAGAFLLDGYPDDPRGMVSLGIALARSFANFRPGGMKVHGAAISLVDGMGERHFRLLAHEGVSLVAEIGVHSLLDPSRVAAMLDVAHRYGFRSRVHFGPEAVPGSNEITATAAARMGAHVAAHVNGGPIAPAYEELDFMLDRTNYWLELTYTGNERALVYVARRAKEIGAVDRLVMGSDTPTGAGVLPRAILRTINLISTFAELPAPEAIAVATGNAADAYQLKTGKLEPGWEADILLLDAPKGSRASSGLEAIELGDLPSISLILIDGIIVGGPAANTMPPKRRAEVHALE